MSDDDLAKKAILARRAKFVAAAVTSLGIACGKTTTADPPGGPAPQPCLAVPFNYDAAHPPTPAPLDASTAADAAADVDGGAAGDASATKKPEPKPKGKP